MKYITPSLCSLFFAYTVSAHAAIEKKGDWGSATFYGSIRVLLTDEQERDTDIADGISRIGAKGFVNLTDEWKGTYRLEGRVDADTGRLFTEDNEFHERVTYIGMKHDNVGEFRAGKQFSPHYLWTILPIDITFHNPRHYNIRWHASENSSIREANSIAYFSPTFSGFSIGALAEIDRNDDESESVDSYNIAGRYVTGPFQLGLSYYDRSDNARTNGDELVDAKTSALALQYKTGRHKAVFRYQDEDILDEPNFVTTGLYYSYAFGEHKGYEFQTRIYNLDNGVIDGNQIGVGFTRKFRKAGQLFLEYVTYDDNASILRGRMDDITLGLRIDF